MENQTQEQMITSLRTEGRAANQDGHFVKTPDQIPVVSESRMGHELDESDLDERFTRYYKSGERVEITWKEGFEDYSGYGCRTEGRKARFYVGKSTGWKPVYLQIWSRNSSGGSAILGCAVESIRGLGIYR